MLQVRGGLFKRSAEYVPGLVFDDNFSLGPPLDPRITFSRPGTTTYIENGVLKTAAIDQPVFENGAWRLEPQVTNGRLWSQNFSNPIWVKGQLTISADAAIGPDLITTASNAVPGVAGTFRNCVQNLPLTAGVTYTEFFIVKANGYNYFQLLGGVAGFGSFYINFDIVAGVETAFSAGSSNVVNRGITPLVSGYFLVWVTAVALATTNDALSFNIIDTGTRGRGEAWVADGTSGVLLFAAQHNVGGLTSYIPTTTAATTRPADSPSIRGEAFASLYNPAEGAIVISLSDEITVGVGIFSLTDESKSWKSLQVFRYSDPETGIHCYTQNSPAAADRPMSDLVIPGTTGKDNLLGFVWKGGVMKAFANGSLGRTGGVSTTVPNALNFVYQTVGPKRIKRLRFFRTAPSDAQIIPMVTP